MIDRDIAILIVTKCTEGKIFNCIKSIAKTVSSDSIQHLNLYVKYTGDNQLDIEAMRSLANSLGIRSSIVRGEYNFARNINELAQLGSESVMLCMNDDVQLVTDSISHCLQILDSSEQIGTVGIKLLFENGTIQHAGHLLLLKDDNFFQITHYMLGYPNVQLPDFVSVGNTFAFSMFRRKDFEECGGLNEAYKKCFEDVEFNWKMLMRSKINVTACSETAYHYESTTRKKQDCLIESDDVKALVSFFRQNKESILKNEKMLERTIRRT